MNHIRLFEDFINKEEVITWLYSNNIIGNLNELDRKGIKDLLRYFIHNNKSIIEKTALKNCHAIGLNSFLLNYSPKIRLFISNEGSEINNFDPKYPIIPIHPHKYDDLFFPIVGKLTHHLYEVKHNGIVFNKYNFIRLNKINDKITKIGTENLRYIGAFSNINKLRSKTLHTVSTNGYCAWLVIETKKDNSFSEIFYHQDLKKRYDLYLPFNNPISFLEKFTEKL